MWYRPGSHLIATPKARFSTRAVSVRPYVEPRYTTIENLLTEVTKSEIKDEEADARIAWQTTYDRYVYGKNDEKFTNSKMKRKYQKRKRSSYITNRERD